MRGHGEAHATCQPCFSRTNTCQSLGGGGASALKARGRRVRYEGKGVSGRILPYLREVPQDLRRE
jgi:hypothetical protein